MQLVAARKSGLGGHGAKTVRNLQTNNSAKMSPHATAVAKLGHRTDHGKTQMQLAVARISMALPACSNLETKCKVQTCRQKLSRHWRSRLMDRLKRSTCSTLFGHLKSPRTRIAFHLTTTTACICPQSTRLTLANISRSICLVAVSPLMSILVNQVAVVSQHFIRSVCPQLTTGLILSCIVIQG